MQHIQKMMELSLFGLLFINIYVENFILKCREYLLIFMPSNIQLTLTAHPFLRKEKHAFIAEFRLNMQVIHLRTNFIFEMQEVFINYHAFKYTAHPPSFTFFFC